VVTSDEQLGPLLREALENLEAPGFFERVDRIAKLGALILAFRPRLYGVLASLIARYKETRVPLDVPVSRYTSFQAAFGRRLLASSEKSFLKRQGNATALIQGLSGAKGIVLPRWAPEVHPVFNRLPIVLEGAGCVEKIIGELDRCGVEASRLYGRPLHHIFDLGYAPSAFPQAVYFAERLLTLPVHPLVEEHDIETMIRVVRDVLRRM